MMKTLLAFVVLIAGIALYIRIAPSDPDAWHTNPLAADDPGAEGMLQLPDRNARTYRLTPAELMAAFDAVAMSRPRVTRLAGSVEKAHVTYIVRSKVIGFPDYVTVKAVPFNQGTKLAIYSRQRFGSHDFKVNRVRVKSWLKQLDASLD